MSRRRQSTSRPGYGDTAHVRNPITRREWFGEVLQWTNGSPRIRDTGTGEVRYFPPHWVTDVALGNHPTPEPAELVSEDAEQ